jgi:hypothetical protein
MNMSRTGEKESATWNLSGACVSVTHGKPHSSAPLFICLSDHGT